MPSSSIYLRHTAYRGRITDMEGPAGRAAPWRKPRQVHGVLGEPGRPQVTVYDQNTGSNPVHLATSGP